MNCNRQLMAGISSFFLFLLIPKMNCPIAPQVLPVG
jgi:hypothetical protein